MAGRKSAVRHRLTDRRDKGDLHLLSAARDAIDRGPKELLVPDDIDGAKRASPTDLGADEWDGK